VLFESLRWLEFGIDTRLFSFTAGMKLLDDYVSKIAAEYRRFPSEFYISTIALEINHASANGS
jgi:hypothetical protein